MESLESVYTDLAAAMVEFEQGHAAFAEKGNKSAAARARKAIGEIKKLATTYRKLSVEATKK